MSEPDKSRDPDSGTQSEGKTACHGTPSVSDSCNRQPFLSDGDCYRGDVDTHQFDDLPFCDTIDPTRPGIPPEVFETPLVLPVPPSCSCIDIEHNFNFGGYKDDFRAKAEFKSNGDCCEGEYEVDFDFELPCPIDKFDDKKFKVSAGWNCPTEHEQVYIASDKDECGISPYDIEFDIGLPCPINGNDEKKIKISLEWDGENEQEIPYITAQNSAECEVDGDEGECSITPSDVTFELGLPCPIPDDLVEQKKKIKIGWTQSGDVSKSESEQPLVKKSDDDCEIEVETTEFDLGLPCPLPDNLVEQKKKIKIDWTQNGDDSKKESEQPLVKKSDDDCEIEVETTDFDLGLPCPIPTDNGKIRIGIEYGEYFSSEEHDIAGPASGDGCDLEFKNPTFNLTIPCPLENLTIGSKIEEGSSWDIEVEDDASSDDGCSKTLDIKLTIPEEKEITVLTGVTLSGSGIVFNTAKIKGRFTIEAGDDMTVPTATHRNICCN